MIEGCNVIRVREDDFLGVVRSDVRQDPLGIGGLDHVVLLAAKQQHRLAYQGDVLLHDGPHFHHRVRCLQRSAVVGNFIRARLGDVVADAWEGADEVLDDRKQVAVLSFCVDRGVDENDSGDVLPVVLGEAKGKRASHRQAAHEDTGATIAEFPEVAVRL